MDANRRISLINTWTENENLIEKLVRQLEEANKIKEKIEEEIPSLRETGRWETKFVSPKKACRNEKNNNIQGPGGLKEQEEEDKNRRGSEKEDFQDEAGGRRCSGAPSARRGRQVPGS